MARMAGQTPRICCPRRPSPTISARSIGGWAHGLDAKRILEEIQVQRRRQDRFRLPHGGGGIPHDRERHAAGDRSARRRCRKTCAKAFRGRKSHLARWLANCKLTLCKCRRRRGSRLVDCGHVVFAAPELRGDQFAVLRTQSLYSRDIGLMWDDADYLGMENSII